MNQRVKRKNKSVPDLPSPKPSKKSSHRALDLYLTEIKELQPFTPEEEVNLAQRAKNGEQRAIHQLITHNLRFVVAVAKKFQHHGIPLEDLINEGNLGLIKAVERYDETRGFRFITYAVWWISQSIRQAIAKTGRVIRLPVNVSESMGSLYRQSVELEQTYEREPTSKELAEINNKTISEIERLIQNFPLPASLDDPLDDSYSTLQDFLLSEDDRPEAQLMKNSILYEVLQVLHTLDEREEYVIKHYFGLDVESNGTLDDIGEDLGISRERVRQIKERALQRLRHATRSHLLRLYLS